MRAYVDESGCMGMKLGEGSSDHFTVIVVLFSDEQESTRCYNRIEELKSTLGVKKEFRFANCGHQRRERFFHEITKFEFSYFGVSVDKAQLAKKHQTFRRPFLLYPVLTSFAQYADLMDNVTVVIDRTGSDEFRKSLARDLKRRINADFGETKIKKVKDQPSHANNLLQLADMVCGAVARSFCTDKTNPDFYRRILKPKELSVEIWPSSA